MDCACLLALFSLNLLPSPTLLLSFNPPLSSSYPSVSQLDPLGAPLRIHRCWTCCGRVAVSGRCLSRLRHCLSSCREGKDSKSCVFAQLRELLPGHTTAALMESHHLHTRAASQTSESRLVCHACTGKMLVGTVACMCSAAASEVERCMFCLQHAMMQGLHRHRQDGQREDPCLCPAPPPPCQGPTATAAGVYESQFWRTDAAL
jgi:hypothetical protein